MWRRQFGGGKAKKKNTVVVWLLVSNIFYFPPYLGKIPNLTTIFQMGRNHQLVVFLLRFFACKTLGRSVMSLGEFGLAEGYFFQNWENVET